MKTNPNDPSNWKYGIFYYNKNDKRLWVPKRIPEMGITVNFANRYSHLVIGGILLVVVILSIFRNK